MVNEDIQRFIIVNTSGAVHKAVKRVSYWRWLSYYDGVDLLALRITKQTPATVCPVVNMSPRRRTFSRLWPSTSALQYRSLYSVQDFDAAGIITPSRVLTLRGKQRCFYNASSLLQLDWIKSVLSAVVTVTFCTKQFGRTGSPSTAANDKY